MHLSLFLVCSSLVFASPSKQPHHELKPFHVPLQPYYRGTELGWIGPVQIGTPPQTLDVIFDSQSDFAGLTVISTNCTTCPRSQKRFDYKKSRSYVGTTFPFDGPDDIDSFGYGLNPNVVWEYDLTPGNETVNLGGVSMKNVECLFIYNESEAFREVPYSGIFGLFNNKPGSFFDNLIAQGLPAILGFYLAPIHKGGSQLTVGGVDHSRYRGEFSTISKPVANYIAVNGKMLDLFPSQQALTFFPDATMSTVLIDPLTAAAIYSLISPDIKPNPDEPATFGIPCSKVPHLRAEIDINFTDDAGQSVNITIPTSELNVGPFAGNRSLCQLFINTIGADFPYGIFGGSFFKQYYVKFDFTNFLRDQAFGLPVPFSFARPI